MRGHLWTAALLLAALCAYANAQYTEIRQPGYCAMRGECGMAAPGSVPEGPLNCPYNGPAQAYDGVRQVLIDFCGEEFSEASMPTVCCMSDQVETMIASLATARTFVETCPACYKNMRSIFCHMTCSPDQSLLFNVSKVIKDPSGENPDNDVVMEGQFYVSSEFGTGMYDSCKDVKFGMSNSLAMLFIGGGADNYIEMLNYMGEPKVMGSTFLITFPNVSEPYDPALEPLNVQSYPCSSGELACVCVDCPDACREPLPIESDLIECYVGSLNCLSFTLILVYGLLLLLSLGILAHNRRKATSGYGTVDAPMPLPKEWKLYSFIQRFYYRLGFKVARHPAFVMLMTLIFVEVCCIGLINFRVETDPVELWVGLDSITREQKAFFDTNFGPFYRTEQMIISQLPDGIMEYDVMLRMFDVEEGIMNLVAYYKEQPVTIQDFCFKPLGDYCVITATTGYWQSNKTNFLNDADWYGHMSDCLSNPSFPGSDSALPCLPLFQDPIKPELALGGYEGSDYMSAQAFVFTFVINNSLDEEYLAAVTEWEKAFVEYLNNVTSSPEYADLRITYFTESGVELELARESTADLITVAISYLVMFIYVSIALGKFTSFRRIVVDTKFTLGVAGVLICIMSVLVSVGLFSAFGIKTSLIIAEVIPFLVLAVGVDNIFLMVNTFEALDPSVPLDQRCAAMMSDVGPSITLSALSESVAFALGTIVSMPAVNSFAAYSTVAIFVDFLLQITCFLALLAVDAERKESKRVDCIPCIKTSVPEPTLEEIGAEGYLQRFVRRYYSSFLIHPVTRFLAVFGSLALLVVLASFIPQVELGLDQTIALPQDSYLIPYFADQASLMEVGAPAYFVIRGGNATDNLGKMQLCYSNRNCSLDSVVNLIAEESRRPDESYIALAAASWIDDFTSWINPKNRNCCRVRVRNESQFCQSDEGLGDGDQDGPCRTCYSVSEFNELEYGPQGEEFLHYLDFFMEALPGDQCIRAGAAAYSDAIVPNHTTVTVDASHFRTYHTVLVTQADYINAYKSALRISERIMEQNPELDAYPYSLWYIYFEQYITIVSTTFLVLSLALLAVFAVTWLILGSFVAALFVAIPVFMIVVDLVGVMAIWNISLNAISLVNLVMALGISVEFCSHITRAYTTAAGTREDRARIALNEVGASVFSGITVTKFLGVVVLAFAKSQIFVTYYFRMYISLVMLGFVHGLVFLPALLAYVGPASVAVGTTSPLIGALDDEEKEIRQNQQRESIYGTINTINATEVKSVPEP